VIAKDPVVSGRVVATGPGIAIPNFSGDSAEPWREMDKSKLRFIPVQAQIGDHALFLKKEAVEIEYQKEEFLVVPQSAVLLLIRTGPEDGEFDF
jgi:co-chaperonin GroES (HSP10)